MSIRLLPLLSFLLSLPAMAATVPGTYAEAEAVWKAHMDSGDYHEYLDSFVQFNNSFHIDERSGCYQLGAGTVNLMLVITHSSASKYAVIEQVFADSDSPKARCFVKAYRGLSTGVPKFVPFVIQMSMG